MNYKSRNKWMDNNYNMDNDRKVVLGSIGLVFFLFFILGVQYLQPDNFPNKIKYDELVLIDRALATSVFEGTWKSKEKQNILENQEGIIQMNLFYAFN